jgi:6-phosphofructokinase
MRTPEEIKAAQRESCHKYYVSHRKQRNAETCKYRETHREQIREYDRKYHNAHLEQGRERRLKYNKTRVSVLRHLRYGITPEAQEQLLAEQNGVCAICGEIRGKRGLVIDHDHTTKIVRGWLCGKCNMGLGLFDDNPMWLEQAAEFLRQAQKTD